MKNSSGDGRISKLAGLEALRGAAALYVVVHHAHLLPNEGIGRLLYFGQEAVIVFFLLSGFVICYSSSRRQIDWKMYLMHRVKRIYPIFIFALALAYCSESLISGHWLNLEKVQLIGNLLMLQDVSVLKRGVWIDTYYGNSPLWSLSYEWWFYMLFIPMGLNKTAWMQDRLGSALFISTIGFLGYQFIPNPFCLFAGYCFIWWAGVELAREFVKNGNLSFRGQTWTLVGLALMTILWGVPVLLRAVQHEPLQLGIDPVLQCRHYLAALIFVTTGILIAKWGRVETFSWIMRPFMLLAPISYAIYVTHQPLLNLAREFANSSSQWLTALIAFPIVLLLGWLLEIRMQASVSRYFLKKRSILKPA